MTMVHNSDHVETLRKSAEQVGTLQHCVKEKGTNRILIGRHRKRADPNWPTVEVEVKDDLHRELIIIHGQVQRGIDDEEAKVRIERIAQILVLKKGVPEQEVCSYMIRNKLLPWTQQYIDSLLPKQYKRPYNNSRRRQKPNIITTSCNYEPKLETQVKKIKTALDDISRTVPDPEATFPFSDCLCKSCPRRNKCY